MVATLVEIAREGVANERLDIAPAQQRVGDDAVELLHQQFLRERRQRGERTVGRIAAERLAVVRRALDRVAQQRIDALLLVDQQLLACPVLLLEQLADSGADRLPRIGACLDGHAVLLSSSGTDAPRMNAVTVSSKRRARSARSTGSGSRIQSSMSPRRSAPVALAASCEGSVYTRP